MRSVDELDTDLRRMSGVQTRMVKDLAGVRNAFDLIDKKKAREHLAYVADDLSELHSRLQSMICRVTVITEVSRALAGLGNAGDLRLKLVLLMDQPDEWWDTMANYTIGQWIEFLVSGRTARHLSVKDDDQNEDAA